MAESEVAADATAKDVVITVPQGKEVVVRMPEWPEGAPGFARLVNGPSSRGVSTWIVGGTAKFVGLDLRAPLAFYCGPLPDGRIASSSDMRAAGPETTVSLLDGRSVRGRARGFAADARPESVWADSGEFESRGEVAADGTFRVHGIPPGPCRVCAVFKRGPETWCGSARSSGEAGPVDLEVSRKDEAEFLAWLLPRR